MNIVTGNNAEDSLEIMEIEGEDGEILDCIKLGEIVSEDGNKYLALQVLDDADEDEDLIISLFKVVNETEDGGELYPLSDFGEFDKIAEKFKEILEEMLDEPDDKE
jgi:uncharacterized protein YrzB (UPF0473 family)